VPRARGGLQREPGPEQGKSAQLKSAQGKSAQLKQAEKHHANGCERAGPAGETQLCGERERQSRGINDNT
jgi:hypothetical protein